MFPNYFGLICAALALALFAVTRSQMERRYGFTGLALEVSR